MTKIAIMSDSHDNVANLEQALAQIRAGGAAALLHCGDLVAPFVIARLAAGFAGPIHIVFGNNEGDGRLLQTVASAQDDVTLHGIYAELELGGRRRALIHYPKPARRIAQSGHFDLVAYGHDHEAAARKIDDCWLVNPGEILGMFGPAQWGLYDTAAHTFTPQFL
jgi:putative phosphoesterase